jgi:hypothetical protein
VYFFLALGSAKGYHDNEEQKGSRDGENETERIRKVLDGEKFGSRCHLGHHPITSLHRTLCLTVGAEGTYTTMLAPDDANVDAFTYVYRIIKTQMD